MGRPAPVNGADRSSRLTAHTGYGGDGCSVRLAVIGHGVRRHDNRSVCLSDRQRIASAAAGKGEVAGEAGCSASGIGCGVI